MFHDVEMMFDGSLQIQPFNGVSVEVAMRQPTAVGCIVSAAASCI